MSSHVPPRLPRFLTRVLWSGLSVIAVLSVCAWLFLDSLVRIAGGLVLSSYGFTLTAVEGVVIGTEYVRIGTLGLRARDSETASQIDNLEIRFTSRGLWQGQFQQLSATRVDLALPTPGTAQEPTSELFVLPPLGPLLDTLSALPSKVIELPSLRIAPYLEESHLSVRKEDGRAQLLVDALSLQLDAHVQWEVAISGQPSTYSPPQLTWQAQVTRDSTAVLEASGSLTESPDGVAGTLQSRVQLTSLSPYLEEHRLLPAGLESVAGILSIEAMLHSDAQALSITGTLAPDSTVDAGLTSANEGSVRALGWRNAAPVRVEGSFQGEGRLDIRVEAPQAELLLFPSTGEAPSVVSLRLDSLSWHCTAANTCSGTQAGLAQVPELALPGIQARALEAYTQGSIEQEEQAVLLHFDTGSRFQWQALEIGDLRMQDFNALVQRSLSVKAQDLSSLFVQSDGVDLFLPDITVAEKRSYAVMTLSSVTAEFLSETPKASRVDASLQVRNLGSELLPLTLRKPELDMHLTLQEERLDAQGTVRLADREFARIEARLPLSDAPGTVVFETPVLHFGPGEQALSSLFFQPPFTADIVDGSVQGRAALTVNLANQERPLEGTADLQAEALSGFYEDIAITGLSTQISGQLLPGGHFRTASEATLHIARLDPGVPIEAISLRFGGDSETGSVSLHDLNATVFEGRLHADGGEFQLQGQSPSLLLEIERLNIGSMLAMGAYENVQATGFISGTLPLALVDGSPVIGAGNLNAESPGGVIRYLSAGATGNATLDFVNQALANYQYDLLETTVDYLPSGELLLGMKLQGLNPDLNNGQRINLNLNISDNIPMLLRSLQAGRSISDTVERALDTR